MPADSPRELQQMPPRVFEDFVKGTVIDLGQYPVSAEEIIEFATEFDPAPFHLSEAGGKASMLGGLSASGWHTCAMLMKMMCDTFLAQSTSQGTPGIDECNWLAPVHAGDVLHGRATVLSTRASASRPGLGIVTFRFEVFKQSGITVLTISNSIMFMTRASSATKGAV